ncbi:hypothetical protein RDWZM_005973 [Blomia tropicalis]|uniref:Uncharacterized protein n=1 Tax=Blomia tropicalis TaxID=40697 RepID=A0A9Q0RMX4_BLOTA|nr:hypothetical protein RDWZM_005973 [Blomia tropicalis]
MIQSESVEPNTSSNDNSPIWYITNPMPKVNDNGELCLTGTIRVKINRKERKASMLFTTANNFDQSSSNSSSMTTVIRRAPNKQQREEEEQQQQKRLRGDKDQSKSSNQSMDDPIEYCSSSTTNVSQQSDSQATDEMMTESIVLSQSSSSGHRVPSSTNSPFSKSFTYSPSSSSNKVNHHSTILDDSSSSSSTQSSSTGNIRHNSGGSNNSSTSISNSNSSSNTVTTTKANTWDCLPTSTRSSSSSTSSSSLRIQPHDNRSCSSVDDENQSITGKANQKTNKARTDQNNVSDTNQLDSRNRSSLVLQSESPKGDCQHQTLTSTLSNESAMVSTNEFTDSPSPSSSKKSTDSTSVAPSSTDQCSPSSSSMSSTGFTVNATNTNTTNTSPPLSSSSSSNLGNDLEQSRNHNFESNNGKKMDNEGDDRTKSSSRSDKKSDDDTTDERDINLLQSNNAPSSIDKFKMEVVDDEANQRYDQSTHTSGKVMTKTATKCRMESNGINIERNDGDDVDYEEEDEEEGDSMHNNDDFDPTEVLKRMKVELKEEFDDDEEQDEENENDDNRPHDNGKSSNMITNRNKSSSLSSGQRNKHNEIVNNNNNNNNRSNGFIQNLFGGAATFDQTGTVDYFQKILASVSPINTANLAVAAAAAGAHSTLPGELMDDTQMSHNRLHSTPQSQLAAFTAAAFAAAQQVSNGATISSSEPLTLDESKKRLIQAILLKQLNSDFEPTGDLNLFGNDQTQMAGPTRPMVTGQTVSTSNKSSNQIAPSSSNNYVTAEEASQRYCTSCNIQFISSKTFKNTSTSSVNSFLSGTVSPSTSAMACGTQSSDNHQPMGGGRKLSQHKPSQSTHTSQHGPINTTSSPINQAGSGSPKLPYNSGDVRKRSNSSWNSLQDDAKEHDFSTFLPNLMLPNGLNHLGENLSLANSIGSSTNTEPIYIAISTNPLILLPFIFNTATNSLVPMSNHNNASNPSLPNFGSNLLGGAVSKPTAPIIFPNGMPQLSNDSRPTHLNNSLSSTSPPLSSHSSSNHSISNRNNTNLPFITTFSNLAQHLLNTGTNTSDPLTSQTSSLFPNHQTTSALISSLINSEIENETKSSGKKRRLSTENQTEETDQPLDLSSGANASSQPSNPKRSKEDLSSFGSIDLSALASKLNFKKDSVDEQSAQENLTNFLQKFTQIQSLQHQSGNTDSMSNGLSFSGFGNSSPFVDQLTSINSLARENPAFAQYLAVAMAALSGGQGSNQAIPSVPTNGTNQSISSISPQVDVVVKQGNSRCVECNIVFYKHENYLVHKELYCASRRTGVLTHDSSNNQSSNQAQTSPSPANLRTNSRPTSAHSSASSTSPALINSGKFVAPNHSNELRSPKMEDLSLSTSPSLLRDSASLSPGESMTSPKSSATIFQYYCAACGIKFTSYDNLQAHQTYYCLKRTTGTSSSTGHVDPNSTSPGIGSMASPLGSTASLLTTQQILAAAAQLQNAEGIDFSSPNALSHQLALVAAAASAAVASQNKSISSNSIGDFHCSKCKATYVTAETLAGHVCSAELRSNDKSETIGHHKSSNSTPSTSSLQTYKCTICGYKGHTMRGMRTHVRVHSEQLAATGAYEEEFIVQNTDLPEPSTGRGRGAPNMLSNRQRRRSTTMDLDSSNERDRQQATDVRKSKEQEPVKLNAHNQSTGSSDGSLMAQNHTCQFCRYTSNYKGNVIRHIKLVHKDIATAQLAASLALQQQALAKELHGSIGAIDDGSTVSSVGEYNGCTSDIDPSDVVSIKCEESAKSPLDLLNGVGVGGGDVGNPKDDERDENQSNSEGDGTFDNKFCSSCNISFTYRNSYLAHKKYYCSSHTSEA